MSENGVRADFYGPTSRPLRHYDAVVHFSAFGGGEDLLRTVRLAGKPIILLPNYNFFNPAPNSLPVVQEHLDLADLVILRTQVEIRPLQGHLYGRRAQAGGGAARDQPGFRASGAR